MMKTTLRLTIVFALSTAGGATAQTIEPGAQLPAPALALTLDEAVRRAVDHNPDLTVVRLAPRSRQRRWARAARLHAGILVELRTVEQPDAANQRAARGQRRRHPRLVLDYGRAPARAVGQRYVERLVGRVEDDQQQPAEQLRSKPAIWTGGRVLATADPRSEDRRCAAAVPDRKTERSDLGAAVPRDRRRHDGGREAGVLDVEGVARERHRAGALAAAGRAIVEGECRSRAARPDAAIDLVQVDAEVADRRENLIRARAAADDGEDRLRRLIMDPAETSFWQVQIEPTDEPSGRVPLPDVEALVAKAMTDRSDVARARNAVSNAETNAAYFANQRLPDVRIEASYRGSGLGGAQLLRTGAFPGVVTGTVNSGFGGVLGQAFGPDYPTWSLGVTVSHPVGRSFEHVREVQAEVERRQAAARVSSVQLDVAASIRQAARQVRSTAEREDAARAGATLAGQRLDAEQRRYTVGLSTSFLVTQAQRDLLQAEVNLLQATLDYQSSVVNFEALQLAPALTPGAPVVVDGSAVQPVPTQTPRGMFRTGSAVQP